MHLAIDIGLGHVVKVNQCQAADATARKCFGNPRAYAADADYRHMRFTDNTGGLHTIEALHAGKAPPHVGIIAFGKSHNHG